MVVPTTRSASSREPNPINQRLEPRITYRFAPLSFHSLLFKYHQSFPPCSPHSPQYSPPLFWLLLASLLLALSCFVQNGSCTTQQSFLRKQEMLGLVAASRVSLQDYHHQIVIMSPLAVTWSTDGMPSEVASSTGLILLGYNTEDGSENLDTSEHFSSRNCDPNSHPSPQNTLLLTGSRWTKAQLPSRFLRSRTAQTTALFVRTSSSFHGPRSEQFVSVWRFR